MLHVRGPQGLGQHILLDPLPYGLVTLGLIAGSGPEAYRTGSSLRLNIDAGIVPDPRWPMLERLLRALSISPWSVPTRRWFDKSGLFKSPDAKVPLCARSDYRRRMSRGVVPDAGPTERPPQLHGQDDLVRSSSRSNPVSHRIDDAVAMVLQSCEDDADLTPETRERIVLAALDLADSVALKYRGRGVDHEDLRQVARLALVHAAARYRPAAGRFTAFAVPTIMGEVKRHFRDHGWVVRPPRSLQESRAAVTYAQESLRHLLGRDATLEEVAEHLGCEASTVRETLLCSSGFRPASLDAPFAPSGSCLGESIVDPEDPYASIDLRAMLRDGLRLLNDREMLVVRLRFEEELSQAVIGERIGVSQMQVSRILTSITHRLRVHLGTTLAA